MSMGMREKNGKTGRLIEMKLLPGNRVLKHVARPTGIEPVLRVPETLVISFSLRARAKFFITGSSISQRALWQLRWPRGPFHRE